MNDETPGGDDCLEKLLAEKGGIREILAFLGLSITKELEDALYRGEIVTAFCPVAQEGYRYARKYKN